MSSRAPRTEPSLGSFILRGSSLGAGRKVRVSPKGGSPHSLEAHSQLRGAMIRQAVPCPAVGYRTALLLGDPGLLIRFFSTKAILWQSVSSRLALGKNRT